MPEIKHPPFIDISHWIDVPDFSKLDPMPWMIGTKATQGTYFLDPSYGLYSEEIRGVGARLLSYHFMDRSNPTLQANWFCEIVLQGELRSNEILACDMEMSGIPLINIKVFLDRCQVITGIRPIIYTTEIMLEDIYPGGVCPEWLKKEFVWIAEYPANPDPVDVIPPWIIPHGLTVNNVAAWQYTDDGIYPGVPGNNVDLNLLNPSYIQSINLTEPNPEGEIPVDEVLYYADLKAGYTSNVRSAPDLQAGIVLSITGPQTVSIISEKVTADGYDWYKINNPTNGYIAKTGSYGELRPAGDPAPVEDKPKKITVEMESGKVYICTQFDEVV